MELITAQKAKTISTPLPRFFKELPEEENWSFTEYSPAETSKLTHCYHRYPAKFIPQLVEKLMDEYLGVREEAVVNDLFMGSGTTIVCAIARGYKATGTDINDVAYLMTKAKATPITPGVLEDEVGQALEDLESVLTYQGVLSPSLRTLTPYIPGNERIDYWFEPKIKQRLGVILARIREVEDERIKTFLLCGFSHILKNCSRWSMSSTKPTISKRKIPADPLYIFKSHIKKMVVRNREFYNIVPKKVRENIDDYLIIKCGDAREQLCEDNSVDIQITSSPYVTSYEYADLHQLSTIWLEYTDSLLEYRRKFMGSAYTQRKETSFSSTTGRQIVEQLKERDKKMSEEVAIFFHDMEECFEKTYRILKPGGRACYVIGDTALRGIPILNAEVFAESMQNVGFTIERVIKRRIPSKILPQTRDSKTGKFCRADAADNHAYPHEFIVIGRK